MPLLQRQALSMMRDRTKRQALQLAVRSPVPNTDGALDYGCHSGTCNALMWDADEWLDAAVVEDLHVSRQRPLAVSLRLRALSSEQPAVVQFVSFHLPYVAGASESGHDAMEASHTFCQQLFELAPVTSLVVAAGDLNVDVRELVATRTPWAPSGAPAPFAFGCTDDSAVFGGKRLTVDACLAGRGRSPQGSAGAPATVGKHGGADATRCSPDADGVWRAGGQLPFFGRGRDAFLSALVHRQLHDDPRLWRLGDAALCTLGCWPFADQARVLGRLTSTAPSRKRPLVNPLAAAGPGDTSESESADN